jgi:EmrB/QacA subfamily drug resistance transporter
VADARKQDGDEEPTPGQLFRTVFPSIMLPMFLAVVDQTIVATALPSIAASLGSVGRVSWVVVGYLVATTVAAPVYGQLRDVYGSKRMMFIALAIFIVSSLLCAAASSVELLTICRILQGLGGGGLMTLSQALIGETIPPRERARYQGYLASVMVTSSTFGPVVGGYLTHHLGWRSVFLINVPLGLIAILLTVRLKSRAYRDQPWRFDSFGLVLFITFIVPLLLALDQTQRMQASLLPLIAALSAISLLGLVGLIRQQRRVLHPLLPITLLRNPTVWRSDALAACHGATLVSLITFLPLYFRVLRGATPATMGLMLLPLVFGIGIGSMLTGRIVSRTGLTTIFPSIGLVLATATLLLFALNAENLGLAQLPWPLFVCGLFMGTVMGVVQVTVQNAAGAASLGSAVGSVQLSRSVGASAGTALVGTVLFASISLGDPETARVFAQLVEDRHGSMTAIAGQATVYADIARAFRAAFLTIAAFAATGAVLAWSIPMRRLT